MQNLPQSSAVKKTKYEELKEIQSDITRKLYGLHTTLFGVIDGRPLQLPELFYAYADTEKLKSIFAPLEQSLRNAKRSINRNDAWNYKDVFRAVFGREISPNTKTLENLIRLHKMPEGHIHSGHTPFHKQDQKNLDIYLSRYGCYKLFENLSDQHGEYSYELAAFAKAFFAFPKTKLDGHCGIAESFIRGEKLKDQYDIALKRVWKLITAFNKCPNDKFNWINANKFMHGYIFDILFGAAKDNHRRISFETLYKSTLGETGTQDPAPFIAPHIMLFLVHNINAFCNKVWQSKKEIPDFMDNNLLEKLAADFFMQVRYDIEQTPGAAELFSPENLFDKNNYSSDRVMIKDCGKMAQLSAPDILLSADEKDEVKYRKAKESALVSARIAYGKYSDPAVLSKIKELKKDISESNEIIYGIDIQEFVSDAARQNLDDVAQLSLNFPGMDSIPSKQISFIKKQFVVGNTSIPQGIPFKRYESGGVGYCKDGDLESINPLIDLAVKSDG
ncbi:MAG: hypothetical protein LBJ18_03110, partial [Rickettsiales bacterium]|nr:hypothetical protein [Rickettsiales bacterium]